MQSGGSPRKGIARSNRLWFVVRSRGLSCHAHYRAARQSVQIQRSGTTFGLTDARH